MNLRIFCRKCFLWARAALNYWPLPKLCSSGGVLLNSFNPLLCKLLDSIASSPLQVMCAGAVKRQPGYRAKNLHRRGFSKRTKEKQAINITNYQDLTRYND